MKKSLFIYSITFALSFILIPGCSKLDNIEEITTKSNIVYRVEGVQQTQETKAYLVTSANISDMYSEMTVKGVKNSTSGGSDEVLFTDTFAPSASEVVSLNQRWEESSYVFYSYPSSVGISPSFTGNAIVFNSTIGTDSKTTPDIILARTVQTRGKDVSFSYKHIYTAVNVIYSKLKQAHSITKITVKSTPTTGQCKLGEDGTITWSNQGTNKDLVDSDKRYATHNGEDVTEDGCKFMTIPGSAITIEVVIDGITVTKTCEAKKAGDIVNFYIEDDYTIKKEDGTGTEGEIVRNPDGTYKMTLASYVTGEYKTTIVAKPMDFILVLDYSSSMGDSYSASDSKYSAATVTTHSYNDWKSNKTKYKATLNGKQYTVTCNDVKDSSGDNIHWAYITDDNGDRYYITEDGSLYKSTNTNPSRTNLPVSTDGVKILPSKGGAVRLWGEVSFSSVNNKTRLSGLKSAVSKFVDTMAEQAKTNNVVHKVGIVSYKNPKFPRFKPCTNDSDRKKYIVSSEDYYLKQSYTITPVSGSSDYTDDNNNKECSGVLYPFRSVLETNTVTSIKAAISMPGQNGCTAIDYGMYFSTLMYDKCRKDSDIGKTIIVFTDGKPTHAGNTISSDNLIPGYSSKSYTDDEVANKAIGYAKELKDKGVKIYTVGVFNKDKPQGNFMTYLSSNYPNATSLTNSGTGGSDQGYYKDASSGNLTEVFEQIAKTSAEASIDIHKDAYVSAIISDAFVLPSDYIEGSAKIKFYECAQTGYDATAKKIIWSDTRTDITSQITCIIDQATQTLKISGFDYGKYFCVTNTTGPFTGKKLIMEFDGLVANEERIGTGENQAIEYSTGLYKPDNTPITMYEPIYINL